jgi:sodium pump decarboxylase gamma subunit
MKKFLLVLALSACVFGMTACGSTESGSSLSITDGLADNIDAILSVMDEATSNNEVEVAASQFDEQYAEGIGDEFIAACEIWSGSAEEIGTYQGIVEDSLEISGTLDDYTISLEIEGSKRNANVELYYTDETLIFPDLMISPQYSFGEKMSKAALNTLLGMGTVFIVLILIMCIISAFSVIPKIEKYFADKAKKNVKTIDAVDNTIAQIIEKEELSDDTELVAVIAAAIAASEGAASTDGFVVRSIKRANTNKWQRA